MKRFTVIGIDDGRRPEFDAKTKEVIGKASCFSGGARHYEIVKDCLPEGAEWIMIKVPLNSVFEKYESHNDIVVFASGDPLFFGFATTIKERVPEASLTVIPHFNSLQTLAHKSVTPYHDMTPVSLTGREWHEFDRRIIEGCCKLGILTDKEHSPDKIAARLLSYGYHNYRAIVGVNLGNSDNEQITRCSLKEMSEITFESPNCLILEKTSCRCREFGIPDSKFELLDNRDKMITKAGIRLLSLSMLDLRSRSRFWDIGFCTGSVSIEAKLQFPHLRITAFEVREEGTALMETNTRRFGTPGIEYHICDFNNFDLSTLESPEAIFIGGHGGELKKMVERCASALVDGGVIVFNSVSKASKNEFIESCKVCGIEIVTQTKLKIDDNNAIGVIKGVKQQKNRQSHGKKR